MLWTASTLNGYAIEATDGQIGTVSDLLFEDGSWIVRWRVVETGSWLAGRKVFLPVTELVQQDSARHHIPGALAMHRVHVGPALGDGANRRPQAKAGRGPAGQLPPRWRPCRKSRCARRAQPWP